MIKIEVQKHSIPQINPFGKRIQLLYIMFLYLNFYVIYSQNLKVALLRYQGFCLITLYLPNIGKKAQFTKKNSWCSVTKSLVI